MTHYLTPRRLHQLHDQLTARDQAIARTVSSLKCLTGSQLQRLHVTGRTPLSRARTARRILARLVGLDVLARLHRRVGGPLGPGSDDSTYVLGLAGQRLARLEGWLPPGRARRPAELGLRFLAHHLAVSELHVCLVEGQRQYGFQIEALEPEPACWRSYTWASGRHQLKPDSFARLTTPNFIHTAFLEVDLATESATTIERKLHVYYDYYRSGQEPDPFPRVIFIAPSAVRAQVIIEAAGRLPADAWELVRVTTFDRLIEVMTGPDSDSRLPA